ncbi:lysostaphin resistance A-like protein [Virgibacillus soli]|uniref:CPBP family intramembrane glutamic endopeptidase n=1 Tax=Paracerasibacillus soli TaxID=480284 RepID=A0ABU5CUK9_9BACI|nr:CPBP family intramembrane glutamic endopeptidase [Virgibacillus soli]MDY0409541.1 CPBP family intramembrane glutamic endopeptidase [Virgibacillus soli]
MFEEMKIRSFVIGFIGTLFVLVFLFPSEEDSLLGDTIFSYTLFGIFPFIWLKVQTRKQQQSLLYPISFKGFSGQVPNLLGLTLLLFIFSIGAVWVSSYGLSFFFPNYVEEMLQDDTEIFGRGIITFLFILYICLVGPIVEEYIFRGLLLKRLERKFHIIASLIITNIIFGILHMDIIGAFIFGIVMSLLYLKTNNLLVPIFIHICNNTFVYILLVLDVPMPDFLNYTMVEQLSAVMLPNLILFLIPIPFLYMYIKQTWKGVRPQK